MIITHGPVIYAEYLDLECASGIMVKYTLEDGTVYIIDFSEKDENGKRIVTRTVYHCGGRIDNSYEEDMPLEDVIQWTADNFCEVIALVEAVEA